MWGFRPWARQPWAELDYVPPPPGAMSANTTVTFTTSAVRSARGALVGATSPAFAPSGALGARGALSGAASPAFAPNGVLKAFAPLTGVADFAFAPAGILGSDSGPSFANISGSVTFGFDPSARMSFTEQYTELRLQLWARRFRNGRRARGY